LPIVIGVAAGIVVIATVAIAFVARRYFTSRQNPCRRNSEDTEPLTVVRGTDSYGAMHSPRCANEVDLLAEAVIPSTSGKEMV
jgi:hypothetical protein